MSWIIGCWGSAATASHASSLKAIHPSPYHQDESAWWYVAAGGLPATCRYGALPSEGAWLVAGLGLTQRENGCQALSDADWAVRLAPEAPDLRGLDGHFVALRWKPGSWYGATDAVGLRTVYLKQLADGILFSTRPDWLARVVGLGLDLEAFGSHWLTFNQLSHRSFVAGLERLGPGSTAVADGEGLRLKAAPFLPEAEPGADLIAALAPFSAPEAEGVSLGLSGGLDSRALLALLLGSGRSFGTHVFGPLADPDVQVSRAIAQGEGLAQQHFELDVPGAEACIAQMEAYAAAMCATAPATAALKLTTTYKQLQAEGRWMIDGGFGEIARRQYFNRLLRQGRRPVGAGRFSEVLPYLRVPRADVFSREARASMQAGVAEDLAGLEETLPTAGRIGLEDVLDVLAVRTRLPNFFGYEQARLDGLVVNHMPFAQPSVLRAVFATPVAERRGGRLLRRLIRTRAPALSRYPLVKGRTTYPFYLGPLPAFLWTKVKARLRPRQLDTAQQAVLDKVADFVRDLAHSEAVRTEPAYDAEKISALVEDFYGGNRARAAEVDWWLAFELWRRGLERRGREEERRRGSA